jgi:hypothetical protein
MLAVPLRCDVELFAATAIVVVPEPEPELPAATLSQDELRELVQLQPAPAVIATVIVSPPAGDVLAEGLMPYEQDAPACDTRN